MNRQLKFQTYRSQSSMPYTVSSDEEEIETKKVAYSVKARRDMFRRRVRGFLLFSIDFNIISQKIVTKPNIWCPSSLLETQIF